MSKIDGIQAMRGLAALVVVLFHFSVLERVCGPDAIFPLFAGYGRAGVDLFFVISGFIMVSIAARAKPSMASAYDFLVKRVIRIYPPYWVVTFAVFVIWYFSDGNLLARLVKENPNWIASLTLWPQDRYPVLLVGWTLIHEMYFYLLFALALLVPTAWRIWFAGLLAIAILGSGWAGFQPQSVVLKLALHPLTLEFILGGVAALLRPRIAKQFWFAILLAILWLVATVWLTGFTPTHEQFETPWLRVMIFGPSSALLVFAFADLGHQQFWPRSIIALGDASYSLYLLHVPIFFLMVPVWKASSSPGLFDNAIALVVALAVSIGLNFWFFRWIEQPSLKLGRRLIPTR
jgi:exopolysaccharide production protein ExoZ